MPQRLPTTSRRAASLARENVRFGVQPVGDYFRGITPLPTIPADLSDP
jgi:hypothetical protein